MLRRVKIYIKTKKLQPANADIYFEYRCQLLKKQNFKRGLNNIFN